jgi:hypothetical protein
VGAQIAVSLVLAVLDRGLWSLDISITGGFAGTTNATKAAQLILSDADGVNGVIAQMPFIPGQFAWQGIYRFAFQRDGFQLQFNTSATVAGDNLVATCSINGRKSL